MEGLYRIKMLPPHLFAEIITITAARNVRKFLER